MTCAKCDQPIVTDELYLPAFRRDETNPHGGVPVWVHVDCPKP